MNTESAEFADFRRVLRSLDLDPPDLSRPIDELDWKACQERSKEMRRAMNAIVTRAEGEDRDLNERERSAFDTAKAAFETAQRQLDAHAANGGHLPSARVRGVGNLPSGGRSRGAWIDPKTGREVRVLAPGDKLAAVCGGGSSDSIGALVRASITGRMDGLSPMAQQAIATPSAGGILVPEPLAASIIDLARSKSRVIEAGALTVPMSSSTLRVARLDQDPTPYWRAENADITESEAAFSAMDFVAKTVAILCRASVELIEDGQNFAAVLEAAMGAAIGGELDRVALFGAGPASDQPLGLYTTPGVTFIDLTADSPPDSPPVAPFVSPYVYAPLSRAVEAVANANAEAGDFILSPRTWGTIDRAIDANYQPLQPPRSVAERKLLTTTRVPDDLETFDRSDASAIFTGNWPALMIGMRTDMTFEISRTADTAFKKLQVLLRIYMRMDVQLARANQFAIVRGIVPAA